ncbi:hypothetical protein KDH_23830 [Dictyobacter sp. S3.2.2.5]|uniref:N-acetyltransferase domain-containing protein n=1 Tax=Dictyobacter halimunensis TaxID=3026934 RepID=A0ABQ6FMS1_9CHLR|nr:hypothetical protein KDH_23830 [Dictyobacter sp. S3.2.2.5]
MGYTVVTLAERPELEADLPRLHDASWPEFVMEDAAAVEYWGALFSTFPEYQYFLCDEHDDVYAVGHTIPLFWDGTATGLLAGWDEALEQGIRQREQPPNTLCGLSIVMAPEAKGKGLSTLMVQAMKDLAARHALRSLILPLRPAQKPLYPLIPMEDYIQWKREDGSPFDSWLRIHIRQGATIVKVAPRSMVTSASVSQWESWTGQPFPGSGMYVVEGALSPIVIDRAQDTGLYEEPNVWISYTV